MYVPVTQRSYIDTVWNTIGFRSLGECKSRDGGDNMV